VRRVRPRRTTRPCPPEVARALCLVDAAEADGSSGLSAWCYACRGLRVYAAPVPALRVVVVPLTVAGLQVGEQRITFRDGTCADCGAPLSRVGGGRERGSH